MKYPANSYMYFDFPVHYSSSDSPVDVEKLGGSQLRVVTGVGCEQEGSEPNAGDGGVEPSVAPDQNRPDLGFTAWPGCFFAG